METPVEIVFHNMPSSPAVEQEIRDRVEKLDRMYNHLIGCRVSVEHLHRQHRTGNVYEVHIELRVPGEDVVVSREPHHARERYSDPDVNVALRDAFKTAERRLVEFKRKQRGDVKVHEERLVLRRPGVAALPERGSRLPFDARGHAALFPPQQPGAARFRRAAGRRPRAFRADGRRHRPDREQGLAGRGRAGLTTEPLQPGLLRRSARRDEPHLTVIASEAKPISCRRHAEAGEDVSSACSPHGQTYQAADRERRQPKGRRLQERRRRYRRGRCGAAQYRAPYHRDMAAASRASGRCSSRSAISPM